MTARRRRLSVFILTAFGLCLAMGFSLWALKDTVSFFYSPSDLVGIDVPEGRFRLGGMVAEESLILEGETLLVTFQITDYAETVDVRYEGLLPDLFKEGKGAVVMGVMGEDGVFEASSVLAKHDENYMPPEVERALNEAEAEGRAE